MRQLKSTKRLTLILDKVLSLGDDVTDEDLVQVLLYIKFLETMEHTYFDEIFLGAKESDYENLLYELAEEGHLGNEVNAELVAYYSEKKFVEDLRLALDLIEYKLNELQKKSNQLKEVTERYSSDIWKFETITFEEVFSQDISTLNDNLGIIQEFWSLWKSTQK